jgi:hypothetical protein
VARGAEEIAVETLSHAPSQAAISFAEIGEPQLVRDTDKIIVNANLRTFVIVIPLPTIS